MNSDVIIEDHGDHSIIRPPAKLKKKANVRVTGGEPLDVETVMKADQALAALQTDFGQWMRDEISAMQVHYQALLRQPTADQSKKLYSATQDIRGHAHTYGYPVAARIASLLCDHLDHVLMAKSVVTDDLVVKRSIEAIAAIGRQEAKGEHPIACEIERELAFLIKRQKAA